MARAEEEEEEEKGRDLRKMIISLTHFVVGVDCLILRIAYEIMLGFLFIYYWENSTLAPSILRT
ncbi:hypothetical protein LINPERPRIM_LOCUS16612 [Linum perenne]